MINIVNPLLISSTFIGDAHLKGIVPCASFYLKTSNARQKAFLLNFTSQEQDLVNEDPVILGILHLYIFNLNADITAIEAIAGLTTVSAFTNLTPESFYFSSRLGKLYIFSKGASFLATSVTITSKTKTEDLTDLVYQPTLSNGLIISVNGSDLGCVVGATVMDSAGSIKVTSPVPLEAATELSLDVQVSFQAGNADKTIQANWCEYESDLELSEIGAIEFQNRVYLPYIDSDRNPIYSNKFLINSLLNKLILLNG